MRTCGNCKKFIQHVSILGKCGLYSYWLTKKNRCGNWEDIKNTDVPFSSTTYLNNTIAKLNVQIKERSKGGDINKNFFNPNSGWKSGS